MGLSLPSPQWWTLTGESMQCYRLFCYKTISLPPPPPPVQHHPREQALTISQDRAEAESSLYSP